MSALLTFCFPPAACVVCSIVFQHQGFAYIEFLEADAVDNAIMLDNSELRGRQIKVRRSMQAIAACDRHRCRGWASEVFLVVRF